MTSPCYKCETRALGCHSNCDKYAEYRTKLKPENCGYYLDPAYMKRKFELQKLTMKFGRKF